VSSSAFEELLVTVGIASHSQVLSTHEAPPLYHLVSRQPPWGVPQSPITYPARPSAPDLSLNTDLLHPWLQTLKYNGAMRGTPPITPAGVTPNLLPRDPSITYASQDFRCVETFEAANVDGQPSGMSVLPPAFTPPGPALPAIAAQDDTARVQQMATPHKANGRRFPCGACGTSFTRPWSLKRHGDNSCRGAGGERDEQ
jgi:hypothetical protein